MAVYQDEFLRRINQIWSGASGNKLMADTNTGNDCAAPNNLENGGATATEEQERPGLDVLLDRIQQLTASGMTPGIASTSMPATQTATSKGNPRPEKTGQAKPTPEEEALGSWYPVEPNTLAEGGLTESQVEALILKTLNGRAEATGRYLADHVKVPFRLIDPLLQQMKNDRLLGHKGASMMNDYVYQLTELGRERAKKLAEHCSYFGSAPVPLADYCDSVGRQTLTNQHPTEADLKLAFDDLLIDRKMLLRLGPAINSGRGLFLYGAPGNGKTSIAERVTKAFGEHIWIPRALGVDGEIIRLFDPSMHEEVPLAGCEGLYDHRKIDHRWVRIVRPTIIVGGELTMQSLEVTINTSTNVSEAPVQLKSNCGTLVIDDFGRQRMTTDELLNRWIVPLEKRYDFLNLASGKKIQVPFDQLIIFSTNLEPRDLVDDAFLRRIPYKIEVVDPDEAAFRELLKIMAPKLEVAYDEEAIEHLIKKHYKENGRPFRCCQPRDLLMQIRNFCLYVGQEPRMTVENFDFAVENYFAVM
jgi:hypothetical protein